MLVRTRALVLRSYPYSESSKVLRLFSSEHGLVSTIAKGAQRPRSRFGGLLEPFTEGTAEFYHREGRDLHTLSGWDLIRSRQQLGRDLTAFAGASLLAELVLRQSGPQPAPALFATLVEAFDGLAESPGGAAGLTIAAAWRTIAILGYAPQTRFCVACGSALEDGDVARFDAVGGGCCCAGCRPRGRPLAPEPRLELRRMLHEEGPLLPAADDTALQRALLEAFLIGQFTDRQPFRSLDLFLRASAPPHTLAHKPGDRGYVARGTSA